VTCKKEDKRKNENETGRQRLRNLNLDDENIIKYTLSKRILKAVQDKFSGNKYGQKFLEKN
jgi:hypothetical protein